MEEFVLYSSLSLLFILIALRLYRSKPKNLPPSPPSLPIVGHLHLLKHPIHRVLDGISRKYGPIISLKFGSQLTVVVSSLSAVEECFTKNDVVLANRPKTLMGQYVLYNHSTIASSPYDDHWRNLRRIGSNDLFAPHRLNIFLSVRKDEIRRLIARLASESREKFTVVEMKTLLSDLTFNNIMRMVAGKRYYGDDVSNKEEANQFKELIDELFKYTGAANPEDCLPVVKLFTGKRYEKKVKRLAGKFDKFLRGLIDEHRGMEREGEAETMVVHLLSLQKSQPEYYTDERFETGSKEDNQKLIAFGTGRRAYPRARLAHRLVGLTLGSLIQCFEWKRLNENPIDMNEGKGLTMPKAEPLEVYCKARPITTKYFS